MLQISVPGIAVNTALKINSLSLQDNLMKWALPSSSDRKEKEPEVGKGFSPWLYSQLGLHSNSPTTLSGHLATNRVVSEDIALHLIKAKVDEKKKSALKFAPEVLMPCSQ